MLNILPCIDCITLPICRNYIRTNPKNHPVSKNIVLCRIRIGEIKCWNAMDFIYTFTQRKHKQPHTPVKKVRLRVLYRYLKDLKLPNYGEWSWTSNKTHV
jgi:hypothetical protein